MESFRSAVSASKLCQPDTWPINIDEMATLYDSELNILLDQLIPLRQVSRRQRTSDPYFDKECRDSKRRLERAYATASRRVATVSVQSTGVSVDVAAAAATAKELGVVQPTSSVSPITSS